MAPTAYTRSPSTVGVERGPTAYDAINMRYVVSHSCAHNNSPVCSSNATRRSVPSIVRDSGSSCQSSKNTRPSETDGPEKPERTGARHLTCKPSSGNDSTMPWSSPEQKRHHRLGPLCTKQLIIVTDMSNSSKRPTKRTAKPQKGTLLMSN